MEIKTIKRTIQVPKEVIESVVCYKFAELKPEIQRQLLDKEAKYYECPYISNEPNFECPLDEKGDCMNCEDCEYYYPTDEYLIEKLECDDPNFTIDGDFINDEIINEDKRIFNVEVYYNDNLSFSKNVSFIELKNNNRNITLLTDTDIGDIDRELTMEEHEMIFPSLIEETHTRVDTVITRLN